MRRSKVRWTWFHAWRSLSVVPEIWSGKGSLTPSTSSRTSISSTNALESVQWISMENLYSSKWTQTWDWNSWHSNDYKHKAEQNAGDLHCVLWIAFDSIWNIQCLSLSRYVWMMFPDFENASWRWTFVIYLRKLFSLALDRSEFAILEILRTELQISLYTSLPWN